MSTVLDFLGRPIGTVYDVGDVMRFATGDGVTADSDAIMRAYESVADDGWLTFPNDGRTFYIPDGLVFDRQVNIDCRGAKFFWDGNSGTAVQIGSSGLQQRYVAVRGPFEIRRTAAIVQDGNEPADEQLLGVGLRLVNLADASTVYGHRGRIYGFANGLAIESASGGSTNGLSVYDLALQENLIDVLLRNSTTGQGFVTDIHLAGLKATFNVGFYSDVTGSRGYESSRNGATIDTSKLVSCTFQHAKERKILEDGSWMQHYGTYYDPSGGGIDIELTANSRECMFIGGGTLRLQKVLDSGTNNTFIDPFLLQHRPTVSSVSSISDGSIRHTFNGSSAPAVNEKFEAAVLDDDEVWPLLAFEGTVEVSAGPASGKWNVQADGTVTIESGTAGNTDDADTDNALCVFDAGSVAHVRNRLGSTQTALIKMRFKDP